jgi:hypothetical protein
VLADVQAWFAWHDGQKPDDFTALIPETNWTALTVHAVLRDHSFLCNQPPDEIMQPYKPAWVPLFDNGGGDHLCYDRDTGKIVTFYHDDEGRPTAYKSMAALVESIDKGYTKMKAVRTFPGPNIKKWTAVQRVTGETHFQKLPVGACFTYKASYPFGKRDEIFVKLGPDRWLNASGVNRTDALAHWAELAAKPPADSSGYYHSDSHTLYSIREYKKTLKQGSG